MNTMYPCGYVCLVERQQQPDFQDLVLQSPMELDIGLKFEDGDAQLSNWEQGAAQASGDSDCSSDSCDSTFRHQSLLPPFPEHLSRAKFVNTKHNPERISPRPIPSSPLREQSAPGPASESHSKLGNPSQRPRHLPHETLRTKLHCTSRTPSVTAETPPDCGRPPAISFSSASMGGTAPSSSSVMSSFSNSEAITPPTSNDSPFHSPSSDASIRVRRGQRRRAGAAVQFGNVVSAGHGQSISPPLKIKPTSPLSCQFPDLDQDAHGVPALPTADGVVSNVPQILPCTSLRGTPNSPCPGQPLLTLYEGQNEEVSAFDFDSDDEGPSQASKALRKMVSRPLLKGSRSRADTAPATTAVRNFSKPSCPAPRISHPGAGTFGQRSSNDYQHGITQESVTSRDPLGSPSGSACDILGSPCAARPSISSFRGMSSRACSTPTQSLGRTPDASKAAEQPVTPRPHGLVTRPGPSSASKAAEWSNMQPRRRLCSLVNRLLGKDKEELVNPSKTKEEKSGEGAEKNIQKLNTS